MTRIVSLFLALLFLAGPALPRLAAAETLSSADEQTIRSMISGQIDAFRHDDGAAAYGFASPAIQSLYPTVDGFMGMVKSGYPPVYRPQSLTFGPLADSPNGPTQKVFLTGPDGRRWVAIYSMQRQSDGLWKINGCTLVEDDAATI
jgi:hypothetical protein